MPVTSYFRKKIFYSLSFCSVAVASAGRVREIAGFPLEIFYKGRLHGATDFVYFHLSKTCVSPTSPFFPPISTFLEMKRDCTVWQKTLWGLTCFQVQLCICCSFLIDAITGLPTSCPLRCFQGHIVLGLGLVSFSLGWEAAESLGFRLWSLYLLLWLSQQGLSSLEEGEQWGTTE